MANPEHVEILEQGVEAWNKWRSEHHSTQPDLSFAALIGADLNYANLYAARLVRIDLKGVSLYRANLKSADLNGANLVDTHLTAANLSNAHLNNAQLNNANLTEANLNNTNLRNAHLSGANLSGANLSRADLSDADLRRADLSDADLSGANLLAANLYGAHLSRSIVNGADFTAAGMGNTTLADIDLSEAKGLQNVRHFSPSTIGINTLHNSAGKIPEAFLRNCGLSDWQIENAKLFQPELSNEEITNILYRVHDLRAHQSIQINPLFISYSHADSPFVDEVESYLNEKGIRFWRDTHHTTAGRLERQIDRAMRLNPTVLLILSSQSVKSDWVEHEARLARKLEQETGRDVLCPIALDNSWETCRWPERLREQITEYNILDFSNWRDGISLQRMFTRLIEGLDLFYKVEK